MSTFGVLFAKQSKDYALHRPTYPASLYAAIETFANSQAGTPSTSQAGPSGLAVDVACGTGQATAALANLYTQVIGIDSAPEQLAEATRLPNVQYFTGSANDIPRSAVADGSADLVTVAQAFHWFDFPRALAEISRVLKTPQGTSLTGANGVCAVWGYGNPVLGNPSANKRVNQTFYLDTMKGYWNDRRRHVDNEYQEIEQEMRQAFHVVTASRGELRIEKEVPLADFVRYLASWSAYQTFRDKNPEVKDPLIDLEVELCADYGVDGPEHVVSFYYPIFLLLGAKPKK